MGIKSLGYQTLLSIASFGGEVIEAGKALVVRNRSNPTWYWNNFVLMPGVPVPGDLERWSEAFTQAFGDLPGVRHIAFGIDTIDGTHGEIWPFLEAGFWLKQRTVFVAEGALKPAPVKPGIVIKRLAGDPAWVRATELQFRSALLRYRSHQGYQVFWQRRMNMMREMVKAGLGNWYGAFIGDAMVGGLGLFDDTETGRYQAICTDPLYQRQGICRALLAHSAQQAFERGLQRLVLVASSSNSAASNAYALGFEPMEMQVGLERAPQSTEEPR